MRVLVTGGTGRLGRELLRAPAPGFSWRVLSRQAQRGAGALEWATGDFVSGAGLGEAVREVDAVLHLASDSRNPAAVDVEGTRKLLTACKTAGVRHFLYISIIGVDAIPYPYYRAKLEVERLVEAAGIPWSVLRVAQFHAFLDFLLHQAARVPLVMVVPARWLIQSVDEAEVAARVLRALRAGPGGRLTDYAGPEIRSIGQAAVLWRRSRNVRKPLLPLPLPGKMSAAERAGCATAPGGELGSVTWARWLARHYGGPET